MLTHGQQLSILFIFRFNICLGKEPDCGLSIPLIIVEIQEASTSGGSVATTMPSAKSDNIGLKNLNQTVSFLWDYAVTEITFVTYEARLRIFKTFLFMHNFVHLCIILICCQKCQRTYFFFLSHIALKHLKLRFTTIKNTCMVYVLLTCE